MKIPKNIIRAPHAFFQCGVGDRITKEEGLVLVGKAGKKRKHIYTSPRVLNTCARMMMRRDCETQPADAPRAACRVRLKTKICGETFCASWRIRKLSSDDP